MSRLFHSIAIVLEEQPALAIIVCEHKGVNAATFSSLRTRILLQRDRGRVDQEGEKGRRGHLVMLYK